MTEPAVPVLIDEQSTVVRDAAHEDIAREHNAREDIAHDVVDHDDALSVGTAAAADGLAAKSPVIVDRADAPVSVITERFLRAIIEQVPLDRIEELHLFSPLKQGGSETGIAVIAARVPVVVAMPPVESAPELPFVSSIEDVVAEDVVAEDVVAEDVVAVADEAVADSNGEHVDILASEQPADIPHAPPLRHTVYTARYRLVQKGPERGKWEADVVAEADAPLLTVEMVVRGVQRRAGEESETLRFSASQIAHALQIAWPIVLEPAST